MRPYLDSSAVVKLIIKTEAGAAELLAFMRDREAISSEIAYAEAARAILRRGPALSASEAAKIRSTAVEVFDTLGYVTLDRSTLRFAARLPNPLVRTLDAIHVATALRLGKSVTEFITYDRRQAEAATDAGLNVVQPGLT